MRALAFLATALFFCQSTTLVVAQVHLESTAPAWQAVLKANGKGRSKSRTRQYAFKCVQKKSGDFLNNKQEKSFGRKNIIVEADQTGELSSLSQSPFVTGVQKVGTTSTGIDAYQPIITSLDQGSTVEVKITPLDEQHVQLDARFEFTIIDNVQTVAVGDRTTQAPVNSTISQRIIRSVRLGDTLSLQIPAFGETKAKTLEYSINELK